MVLIFMICEGLSIHIWFITKKTPKSNPISFILISKVNREHNVRFMPFPDLNNPHKSYSMRFGDIRNDHKSYGMRFGNIRNVHKSYVMLSINFCNEHKSYVIRFCNNFAINLTEVNKDFLILNWIVTASPCSIKVSFVLKLDLNIKLCSN